MEITGTYDVKAQAEDVWAAMMEPAVLTQCVPACQVIEKTSEESFMAKVKVKFGFIPVRFDVRVGLSNIRHPEHYDLQAQAEGGLAHGAKATGNVEFVQISEQLTRVNFIGRIWPGSKLFELGEPLVQRTADKWFKQFFERFEQALAQSTNNVS